MSDPAWMADLSDEDKTGFSIETKRGNVEVYKLKDGVAVGIEALEADVTVALETTMARALARGILGYLPAEPTPLPELEMLELAIDGVAARVPGPTVDQKAALYDNAFGALADAFGGGLLLDPVSLAAHEYRDAVMVCPPIFDGDEQYHPLADVIQPMATWWDEGEAVDHELPDTPLPEGARQSPDGAVAWNDGWNLYKVVPHTSTSVTLHVDGHRVATVSAAMVSALRAVLSKAEVS